MGSSRRLWGHPPSVPHQFEGPVPPARGVPAAVTCSPRSVLGPLEVEDGEERQEPPQEVSGQRCGEPEGECGRVRAGPGPAPRAPAPRALPQTSRSRAAMLRLTAAALSANRLRGRSAAIAASGTARPRRAAILGSGPSGRPCWGGRAEQRADRPAVAARPSRPRCRDTQEEGRGTAGAQPWPSRRGHTRGRCQPPCLEGPRRGPSTALRRERFRYRRGQRRFRRVTLASPSVRRERHGAARGARGERGGPGARTAPLGGRPDGNAVLSCLSAGGGGRARGKAGSRGGDSRLPGAVSTDEQARGARARGPELRGEAGPRCACGAPS